MDKSKDLEWNEAQKIIISMDLVAAARQQVEFLAAVDRHRCLYDGPLLLRAIHRYKNYWLPLLAKHSDQKLLEGPLVVPLDCEWIWHCHRLNPVQYKADCERVYGRVLDNRDAVSSVNQKNAKSETEEIWIRMYPEEQYELDFDDPVKEGLNEELKRWTNNIEYDLVSAVKRQSSFFYQISRPSMEDERFLKEAVARYKGFLYLIKQNRERGIDRFCVPTYDIDLIWHSHQLQPTSYCKDVTQVIGKVLQHDDMDSDRSKGKKLDIGFTETTKQWEDTFGKRYWKAGAMYRGNAPNPVTFTPQISNLPRKFDPQNCEYDKHLNPSRKMIVEVLLEITEVRNVPVERKEGLFVLVRKKQPDMFFVERRLGILAESGNKEVIKFHCEASGDLVLTLVSNSSSNFRTSKVIGSTTLSLQTFLDPTSDLSTNGWFELTPRTPEVNNPICLHVFASSSIPEPATYMFRMVRFPQFSPMGCFFPLPQRTQPIRHWTRFIDYTGNHILSIQFRNPEKDDKGKGNGDSKVIVGIVGKSNKEHKLAQFTANAWFLLNSRYSLDLGKKAREDGQVMEIEGTPLIKLFSGRKLAYELRSSGRKNRECEFITAVEFSAENPYGKAIALINLKCGHLEVTEEWFVLPGILLAFILSEIYKREGQRRFTCKGETIEETSRLNIDVTSGKPKDKTVAQKSTAVELGDVSDAPNGNVSECGNNLEQKSSSRSGTCGNHLKENSSSCGGCGSACGDHSKENSSSCGGCGSGCGNHMKQQSSRCAAMYQ